MKYTRIKDLMTIILLNFVFIWPALAQTGFDEDVEDVPDEVEEPEAPINSYTGLLLVAGCTMGYVLLRRDAKKIEA